MMNYNCAHYMPSRSQPQMSASTKKGVSSENCELQESPGSSSALSPLLLLYIVMLPPTS